MGWYQRRVHGDAQLFCTQALLGVMIALRLTLLATAAFAAPAADADADPQLLLGHGLAYAAPLVHHVVPVCKVSPRACARTSPPRFSRLFAESPLLRPRLLRRLKKILVARVPPQHRAMIYHGIV